MAGDRKTWTHFKYVEEPLSHVGTHPGMPCCVAVLSQDTYALQVSGTAQL